MSEINLVLPGTMPTMSKESDFLTSREEIQAATSETMQQLQKLSEAEQRQVDNFAKQINLHDSAVIASYGEAAQRKLETLTDGALKGVAGRDTGEIGKLLTEMSVSIKNFNDDTVDNKTPGIFRRAKKKAETLRVKYEGVTVTLDRIKKDLEGQRMRLLTDVNMLDGMYQQNLDYYKELTMYILAGRQKLEETQNGELEELKQKAEMTGSQEDAFLYNDLRNMCENFDKQLYDLELTRTVCLQTAPQIRLVQNTNAQLVRKIQSSINNSIPIWKQKLAIALAMEHNRTATEAQKSMTDLTSRMLEENAKLLHMGTVAAAKEAERGIIDIESVVLCNSELIATIDDVLNIQEEGRKARAEAKIELRKAEEDLRQKLLSVSQRQVR